MTLAPKIIAREYSKTVFISSILDTWKKQFQNIWMMIKILAHEMIISWLKESRSYLPILKNWTSLSYFSKPKPEKTQPLMITKTRIWKTPGKLKLDQTLENFVKKGCILAKFWSKSLKSVNSKTRPVFTQFS